MRPLLYVLAAIGGLTVLLVAAVVGMSFVAHRGQRRRQRSWRDQHLLDVAREHGPLVVADNPSTWLAHVDVHDLRAPRGYRP